MQKHIAKAQEKYQKAADKIIVELRILIKKFNKLKISWSNRISKADDKFIEDLNKVSKQIE